MGRGDIKTKKGKIASGSFGNKRKQRVKKENAVATTTAKPKKAKVAKEEVSEEAPAVKKTKKTTKKTKDTPTEE